MKIDFGIVCHKDITQLEHVLTSCRACGMEYQIYVVDNSEDAEIGEKIKSLLKPEDKLFVPEANMFYTKSINHVIGNTDGDLIFFICPAHTHISDITWLDDAVDMFNKTEQLGLTGKIHSFPGIYHYRAESLIDPKITPERRVPNRFNFLDRVPREVVFDQPTQMFIHGGVFGLRREVLKRTGPFDEGFVHAYADAEFSLRLLLAGYGYGNLGSLYSNSDSYVPPALFKIVHVKPPEAKPEEAVTADGASGEAKEEAK